MSDQRLREAERRWRDAHDLEAEVALVQERLRAGLTQPLRVELAAELGSGAAQRITGVGAEAPASRAELLQWGRRARRFGQEACARLILAELRRLLELVAAAQRAATEEAELEGPSWPGVAAGWVDRVESWVLAPSGAVEREEVMALRAELRWMGWPEVHPVQPDLEEALGGVAQALETGRQLAPWCWTDVGPAWCWSGESAAAVWAASAREVVPWALGHRDPLRARLDELRIATPCGASWDAMEGDERTRHCKQCDRSVHDLSHLTLREARLLLARREGRLCVRLYRREDGTLLTRDCPDWRRRPWREPGSELALMGDVL